MFQKMKRVLSLVLALAMMVSAGAILTACGDENVDETTTGGSSADETTTAETTTGAEVNPYAPEELTKDPNGEYTYNVYTSTFPTLWNVHDYETNTDSIITDYTSAGFYTFDYNETYDGYALVEDMAIGEPVDVTSQYVGEEWGIAEGDTAKAWKVTIRQDIKWQDGTPITAQNFVNSIELLLNPEANNYRADSVYNGSFQLVNAQNYFYGGKTVTLAADSIHSVYSEDLDAGLVFSLAAPSAERNCEVSMRTSMGFPASYDAVACANYLIGNHGADMPAFTAETAAAMEGKTLAEIKADATLKAAWEALIGWWQTEPNEELDFFVAEKTYEEYSFDKVGVKAVSDYEIVYILVTPLEGFYLKYNMSPWLVHEDLYKSCIKMEDGVYYNTYGTSPETTMSYGPYMLETFQNDKQFTLVKNPYYFGYNDAENANRYWTTKIVYDYVQESTTALELFEQGKLDSKGLNAEEMQIYSKSEHTYYQAGDSTFFIALNPDLDALTAEQAKKENTNKTILTIKEFRMALSFALDRSAFCLATSPTNGPAFGVYSSIIVSDPENGTAYRTTEQAKDALVNFWGLADEIGEGKLYADKDEAIESITGYNLDLGKEYFNKAYDAAIAQGLMDEDDVVEICIGIPNAKSTTYNNGYDFLVNNYTEAVKGTKLEGKLTFTKDDTIGNDFADALKSNQVNMIFFVGWTGSALDPYGLMEAYTSTDYQYDPAWNTTTENLTIAIDGVEYTATVWAWTEAMGGKKITITAADGTTKEFSAGSSDNIPEIRLDILAALEGAVLQTYDMIPLADDASASLKGMQIRYYVEEYIYGVGRGGVKYMQYNYTDAEWDAFVAAQGGKLNYK